MNGWTNWETWNVGVHFDNDEGLYEEYQYFMRRERDAQDVERFVRELLPDGLPDMPDYDNVNWEEICEVWSAE